MSTHQILSLLLALSVALHLAATGALIASKTGAGTATALGLYFAAVAACH